MLSIHPTKKPRKSYTLAFKPNAIGLLQSTGPTELSKLIGVPIANLKRWKQKTAVLLAFEGNKRRKNLDGAGRPEEIPDTIATVAYMNKMRDNERAHTCTHLVNFIKRHHRHWLQEYLEEKKRGQEYRSLLKLLQLFCARHEFTQQKPAKSKKRQDELEEIRRAFAVDFYGVHDGFSPHAMFNIWAVRGGNSKISSGEKQSYRMATVLGARANREKLPILFIMRGQPGGLIERSEFESFPMGHFYAVQESAWMDERVWTYYLESLLKPQVREPSVLLADNFDSHVSAKGHKTAEQVGCLIPPNATSVVQPLDVGVMAS
ncbi:Aste57867_8308 [Aphanomyces stellatus]|uniref:Aste57867_8308 protein n=1 Tax=Aphanomyces stellatus TaxID=120398 RepID=A0A485KK08_9STRA|nr:hypothetical protein As57867_008277 [Aphanomyces stellatus]VFT85195.1 Aste57867_8308 [Aphanomyces stellatus]